MKKLIFLIPFSVVLVALYLSTNFHTLDSTDRLTELLPAANQENTNTRLSDQNVKEIVKNPGDLKSADESDSSIHHEGSDLLMEKDNKANEELAEHDSQNDVLTNEHSIQRNPGHDTIDAEMDTKARDTWIGDPETMDPDELHSVQYNRLLERFGDIPEVHTYMEYMRNPPMTINGEIAGLEATIHLFPAGSTRRTLALYKWMKANGGYNAFEQGIPIGELRDLGITVEIDETDEGWGYYVTTK